jgi:hypothetical protein
VEIIAWLIHSRQNRMSHSNNWGSDSNSNLERNFRRIKGETGNSVNLESVYSCKTSGLRCGQCTSNKEYQWVSLEIDVTGTFLLILKTNNV